jgi:pimeloyl-ACP methyl ester carboxylesterase
MADSVFVFDPHPQGRIPIVLLHGLGADYEMWQLQLGALQSAGFRPLSLDVPGFGRSKLQSKTWCVRSVAQQMADWMAHERMIPCVLVGISMGGVLAQQWALDFPQQVRALVLVNTFARLRPRSVGVWWYFLRRAVAAMCLGPQAQAELVARRVFPHPQQEELRRQIVQKIVGADRKVYQQAMRALLQFDVLSRLAELKMPTLVLSGLDDRTVPLELQRQMAERIAFAQQIEVPGAGHGLPVDSAEVFNRFLLDFLCSVRL